MPDDLNASAKVDPRTNVRAAFVETVEGLLLGPIYGEDEMLASAPLDTYLTGILWPRNEKLAPEEDEQLEGTGDVDDEATADDSPVELFSTRRPSSIGLTVQLSTTSGFRITVIGGFYTSVELPSEDASDNPLVQWQRMPLYLTRDIPAGFEPEIFRTSEFRDDRGNTVNHPVLEFYVRHRKRQGRLIITVTLINRFEAAYDQRNEKTLFQSRIMVEPLENVPFEVINQPPASIDDEEDVLTNELLYRDAIEFGVGHGVAADWDVVDDHVTRVFTTWMPRQDVAAVSPDGHQRMVDLAKSGVAPFSAEFLSNELNGDEIKSRLNSFCDEYGEWIKDETARLKVLGLNQQMELTARRHLTECAASLSRMRKGISVLNDKALLAFCLANRAMDMQSKGEWRADSARPLVWRPFQLAFLLLTVPSLINPEDTPERECMDLLWFP